ncbi:MAG: hypothetical protein HQM04_06505 [Magnetococcales bacterium]|nr:hypothetical protein [Magnetococcales bacterium]MBF0114678.1 hypothetical protein [Magnetococcales bacterium]
MFKDPAVSLPVAQQSAGIVISRNGNQVQVATLRGMVGALTDGSVALQDRVVIEAGVARLAQKPTLVIAV